MEATYLHGRLGKALQVCSRAVVVAMGVNADCRRELLGAGCSPRRTQARSSADWITWPPRWLSASPRPQSSGTRPEKTCWPTPAEKTSSTISSRSSTGKRSGAPTCWNGSMSHREMSSAKRTIKRRFRIVGIFKSRGDYTPSGRGVAGAGRALAAGVPPHVLRRKHGRHPRAGGSAGPAHPRMRGATPSTRAVL